MNINLELPLEIEKEFNLYLEKIKNNPPQESFFSQFLKTIQSPEIGFYDYSNDSTIIQQCRLALEKFKDQKTLCHVGIGGSGLGPQFLINCFSHPQSSRKTIFIDNVDTVEIEHLLANIDLKKSFFHIVSKSGSTIETLTVFLILVDRLKQMNVLEHELKNFFIFTTDPEKSELLSLAKKFQITCLPIPSNIGGRFSLFTPVGLIPCLFMGINVQDFFIGCNQAKHSWQQSNIEKNELVRVSHLVLFLLQKYQVNQTVMMPYSSQLKFFSLWFGQLWAESLGKNALNSLTPIPALGATDQHSLVQLFVAGKRDKLFFMLEVMNRPVDIVVKNHFAQESLKPLHNLSLNQLLKAEFEGTLRALIESGKPVIRIQLTAINEVAIGRLCLFFMALTALMGEALKINAFDQPGVEAGKRFAKEWLKQV
jgi:glucose-6-phosphate isomerase